MINILTNHEPALLRKILDYLSGTPQSSTAQCLCCRAALYRYQIPLVSKTVYGAMSSLYVNLTQCPQLSQNIIDSIPSTKQSFLYCWQHKLTFDDSAQLDNLIGDYKSGVPRLAPVVDPPVQPDASMFTEPNDLRVFFDTRYGQDGQDGQDGLSNAYIHTDNMDSLVYFVKHYLDGTIKVGHFCCGGAGVLLSLRN